MSDRRTITFDQFKEELAAQGVTREHFAVVCPNCGTVQSRQDFVDAGVHPTIEEAQKNWGFNCIGRFTTRFGGCDWTLGGLLQIHKLVITFGNSDEMMIFEPATAEQAKQLKESRQR